MWTMVEYAISAILICFFVYCWGSFKKQVARGKFASAHSLIMEEKYSEAIEIYQDIASEMQGVPEYWYDLAVVLAKSGATEDALGALKKLFRLSPEHQEGRRLADLLELTPQYKL